MHIVEHVPLVAVLRLRMPEAPACGRAHEGGREHGQAPPADAPRGGGEEQRGDDGEDDDRDLARGEVVRVVAGVARR